MVKIVKISCSDPASYTTKGANRAYVQYRQPVPDGFERLRFWPVDVFNEMLPPRFQAPPAK